MILRNYACKLIEIYHSLFFVWVKIIFQTLINFLHRLLLIYIESNSLKIVSSSIQS